MLGRDGCGGGASTIPTHGTSANRAGTTAYARYAAPSTHPPHTHTHTQTPCCICTSVSGASCASCVSWIGGSQHQHVPGATPHLARNVVRVMCVLRVLERLGLFAGDTQHIFHGSGREWQLYSQRNIHRTLLPWKPMVVQRWLKFWWHHKTQSFRNKTLYNMHDTSSNSRGNSKGNTSETCTMRNTHTTRNTTSKGSSRTAHVDRVQHEKRAGHVAGGGGRGGLVELVTKKRAVKRAMGNKGDGSTNNCILVFLKRCPCTLHHGPHKAAVAAATIHLNVDKYPQRNKYRRKKKTVFSGAPMEAPTSDATTLGSAVSLHVVPMTMALKRKRVVRSVGHVPHPGRATRLHAHSHPLPDRKTVGPTNARSCEIIPMAPNSPWGCCAVS